MLGEITVGVANTEFWVSLFQTFKERPTHDSHEGFRFERLASLDFELDLAAVQCLVTGLTQRDEIVRRIAPAINKPPTIRFVIVGGSLISFCRGIVDRLPRAAVFVWEIPWPHSTS